MSKATCSDRRYPISNPWWKAAVGLTFALALPLDGQEVTDWERFELFTECAPIYMRALITGEEAEEIGLTSDRIKTMAESRLRAARLWSETIVTDTYLQVGIAVFQGAFAYKVIFSKYLYDSSGNRHLARTWQEPGAPWPAIGTHGGNAGFIMQRLSEDLDAFILEYLRVNEGSC